MHLYTGYSIKQARILVQEPRKRTVNALEKRNRPGAVLDGLERTGEPIILSKGRRPRAVLISMEDLNRHLVDRQAEDRQKQLLERAMAARAPGVPGPDSLIVLRELRGELR
jgi:PHD/YefM family antitoxin component YafN of YafNO toxin-antitoxin module